MIAGLGIDRRRAFTAIAVLLIAFGSGHVMQTVLVDEEGHAATGEAPNAAPILKDESRTPPLPVPPAATLVPIRLETPPRLRRPGQSLL